MQSRGLCERETRHQRDTIRNLPGNTIRQKNGVRLQYAFFLPATRLTPHTRRIQLRQTHYAVAMTHARRPPELRQTASECRLRSNGKNARPVGNAQGSSAANTMVRIRLVGVMSCADQVSSKAGHAKRSAVFFTPGRWCYSASAIQAWESVMKKMHCALLRASAFAGITLLFGSTAAQAGNIIVNVAGTKTASGTFTESGTVTYTVILTNSGNGTQADNPGNEFTDVLPAGLTLISATASAGTAVATVATNTASWNGSIAASGSVTITIKASINTGTMGMVISNQGTISFDADGNGTNESSALTDDPTTGAANDPTSFTVGTTPVTLQSFDVY